MYISGRRTIVVTWSNRDSEYLNYSNFDKYPGKLFNLFVGKEF
jgi:hypothetical protein